MSSTPSTPAAHPPCSRCQGTRVVRNGTLRSGSPQLLCRDCGRRFVAEPKKVPVSEQRQELIRRLLLERMSLRGIAQVTGVSRSWLQRFVNNLYREETPWEPGPLKKKSARLTLEADEMWSYVGRGDGVWWIWVALDADTRRVVAMVAGDRSEFTARCLWNALPDEYRDEAMVYNDFWSAYSALILDSQHVACDKGDGLTCHVERFWCTVRQRCAWFVRKTLSFSKCDLNHTGSLWYFIHHYNTSLR